MYLIKIPKVGIVSFDKFSTVPLLTRLELAGTLATSTGNEDAIGDCHWVVNRDLGGIKAPEFLNRF